MKVILASIGDLRDYFGREPLEIQLPEGATVDTLYRAIAARWGSSLPPYLWDGEKSRFKGPVYLIQDSKILSNDASPLRDGEKITIMKALAGG